MLTTEQLKARKRGIGGSDAAAVCGVSKWKTPLQVYLDKINPEVEEVTNPIFDRGHTLEPLVLKLFERETGKIVKIQKNTLTHDKYHFMLANIDGYLPDEKALVEAKTSSYNAKSEWGDPMTDQIPDDYFVQCQHCMSVTNTLVTYIPVIRGSEETLDLLAWIVKECGIDMSMSALEHIKINLKIYEVKRDDHFIDRMIKILGDFWVNNVTMGIPPECISYEDVKSLFYFESRGKHVVATQESFVLLEERNIFKQKIKDLEFQVEEIEMKLMNIIRYSEKMIDEEGRELCSWKKEERRSLDEDKLKAEISDVYNRFPKVSTSRTLRFKRKRT